MFLVSSYFVMRYAGTWAEADSATFSRVIIPFVEQGRLVPASSQVYPNGYSFQAISAVLLAITGLELPQLQQLVYPFVSVLVILPAWLFYREVTGSGRGAVLGTILLFTQPEFLFVILRSSHEKFTRSLMLICLYLLIHSFKQRANARLFATNIVLFYLMMFTFISSNNLLANSFIAAIGIAFFLGIIVEGRSHSSGSTRKKALQRLFMVVLTCFILVYLFVIYIYTPANHDLLVVKDTWERIRALFFDTQTNDNESYTQAYAYISFGWLNPQIFLLVSIANWLMLGSSLLIWVRQSWLWLRYGLVPQPEARWLIWLMYAAFALQGGLSVLSDATGALGSNMQHRLIPSVSIIGIAIISQSLSAWQPPRFARSLRLGFALTITVIAMLSVMKATNEPLLSNKWTFYRKEEIAAMDWSVRHLEYTGIWTEFDERLRVAYLMAQGETSEHNYFQGYVTQNADYTLLSDITRLRSNRLNATIPVLPDALRIYDNGFAQLYHARPLTPFQR